jgi:hypothetical protein
MLADSFRGNPIEIRVEAGSSALGITETENAPGAFSAPGAL